MLFSESLKKYGDFQRVYKRGRSYANKYLIMYVLKQNEQKFVGGLDIVVIARPGAKERSFFEIESALLHLGRLHSILKEEEKKEVKKEHEEGID